ncbi:MAG TPA: nucleoside monophosphate kinase [Candidatus Saccharimonadales bacterium]|nr:nucleoside monophosphate kinase [Candidatus Saccharimonadales bacterium]
MILLMGAAGAGKSMQGHQLADEYGYAYISSGEVFRVLFTGRRRHEMLEGRLLSDGEVIRVIDRVMEFIDTKEQFILDGFPRTKPQVDWLLMQVEAGRVRLPVVVNLEIGEGAIRDRLQKRARLDDTEAAISQRYNDYEAVTRPLLKYMQKKGIKILEIDAEGSPAEVHDRICKALKI